jgi:excisionase family DNA binding protein
MHLEQLLTEKELAARLHISLRHVATLRAQRLIPFFKLGRSVRFKESDVARALEKLTIKEHGSSKA